MVPPAPPRLSTMICWPRISPSLGVKMRPMISVLPPGANGMTMRTGLVGYDCAWPQPEASAHSTPAHPRLNKRERDFEVIGFLLYFGELPSDWRQPGAADFANPGFCRYDITHGDRLVLCET